MSGNNIVRIVDDKTGDAVRKHLGTCLHERKRDTADSETVSGRGVQMTKKIMRRVRDMAGYVPAAGGIDAIEARSSAVGLVAAITSPGGNKADHPSFFRYTQSRGGEMYA